MFEPQKGTVQFRRRTFTVPFAFCHAHDNAEPSGSLWLQRLLSIAELR